MIHLEKVTIYSLSEVKQRIDSVEQSLHESLEGGMKKRSGTYYTPDFIVKYMVDKVISNAIISKINAVQNDIYFKNIRQIAKNTDVEIITKILDEILPNLRVCDIAMGWGVFLLHAFDFLFSFYSLFKPFIHKRLNQSKDQITTSEWIVHNILTNNIWGIDISQKSVDLAKLKMIEKALTSLNEESSKLPDSNLLCTNSLTDAHIFRDSRNGNNDLNFDVIIGNPPYINVKKLNLVERKIYSKLFQTYNPNGDISNIFWEKSIEICKKEGWISFITPRYWLEGNDSDKLREYLLSNSIIHEIIDFRSNRTLFLSTENKLGVDTAIITIQKQSPQENTITVLISRKDARLSSINRKDFNIICFNQNLLNKKRWSFEKNYVITQLEESSDYYLGDDKKYGEFSGICNIGKGCSTGNNRIFKLTKLADRVFEGYNKIRIEVDKNEFSALRELIKNSDISRFHRRSRLEYWIFLKDKNLDDFPNIQNYLSNYLSILERTQKKYGLKNFYDYAAYRSLNLIDSQPKIICPYQAAENRFALVDKSKESTINETDVITLAIKDSMTSKINPFYLLSILNSEVIQFFSVINNKKVYNLYDFRSNQIANFPIKYTENQIILSRLASLLVSILDNSQQSFFNLTDQTSSIFNLINMIVYELYFRDLLSTELMVKVGQTLDSQESDSIDVKEFSRVLNSILANGSIKKDIEKIEKLEQVQDIRKYIFSH